MRRSLTEEAAHRRPLPETSPPMTVAGPLSHLRWVEYNRFERVLLGGPDLAPWTEEDPNRDFRVDDVPLDRLVKDYRRQCARSVEIVRSVDPDRRATVLHPRYGSTTARWIVLHMIEGTARHAGHPDIMRELLDGRTGCP
ncbi:DUF664 domain-containing protein [Thermomonospora catenispora]|uniref:mycothiol transferase n=1 Tax=Thermomonospora catenispora TaxID=2493090 RepID=UPI001375C4A3|nr:DUF664 domain-containing protein [Thermomonospora catenispora]